MDKEAILDKRISCTCNEGYATRNLADPNCPRHSWDEEIKSAMDEAITELRKENNELSKAFETNKDQFMELATHATDLQFKIAEQQRTIDELRGGLRKLMDLFNYVRDDSEEWFAYRNAQSLLSKHNSKV